MTCEQARPLIGAYADGEVGALEGAEIQSHLSECEACSAELTAIEALRGTIRQIPQAAVSESLRQRIEQALPIEKPKREARPLVRLALAFAAGILIAILGANAWRYSQARRDHLVSEIVQSHARSLLPGQLMGVVSTNRHTVKPWFTGKTAISPTPWDLTASGFPLLGGRLDLIDARPIPVVVYGRRKHFVNLFVLPSEDSSGEWSADRQGYHLRAWDDAGLEYVAVSDVDAPDLAEFEKLYRSQKP